MSLFPKWIGQVTFPPLPERKLKIGRNYVHQVVFRGAECRVRISESQLPGYDLITTDFAPPFRELLLRHKGVRRVVTQLPILRSREIIDRNSFPDEFTLEWDTLGSLETFADQPEKVLESWINKFSFRTADDATGLAGLRRPQTAALHAICAHFSIGEEFDAATVVLPTGTGKTETMIAAQVYCRLNRTLVIVPTDALRNQISQKFISLGVLPETGCVPLDLAGPRVAVLSGGVSSIDEATEILATSNVIVALPNTLEASDHDAVKILTEECSDLIVDEAHHITAATWLRIRNRFAKKRILQFTATPFRRDGKRVDGKIIFNFKLGDAQAADYYRSINLRTVEEYGDTDARDRAIAEEATAALYNDVNTINLDHLLMARTSRKDRAEEIVKIYQSLAPDLNPVAVYSGPGRASINEQALSDLLSRKSRIIVCVDMLGEGFDLPNLKIAALHDAHKSLAVTLQFTGRFTRRGAAGTIGDATVVINVADREMEQNLANLYAEGADWDRIIRRLSEDRIDKELRLQDVVLGLKNSGDLHKQLSLWNLRPALSAQFFRTKCATWNPLNFASVLPTGALSWHAYDEENRTLVAVVYRSEEVHWGNYQNVLDTIYDLVIVHWDHANSMLCLFASDFDAMRSEKMAQAITNEDTQLVSGPQIFKIVNNVELPLVKSLGSSRVGAISFTSYFGPNVTEGLASIEKSESVLNNLACVGYENGERVLWAGTQKRGKIWQQKAGTVSEWLDWIKLTWAKVTSETEPESNIVRDFLRPEKLVKFHTSAPISVQWGEQAQMRYKDRQFVVFGNLEIPVFEIDLELETYDAGGLIEFRIASASQASVYRLIIDGSLPGGYSHQKVSGHEVLFRYGTQPAISLEEYLQKDPFIIRYADGTYSYNCYHIPTNLDAGTFDRDRIETWDWGQVPLNAESMGKAGDKNTIQYRAFDHLKNEYDIIFNDDGKGEAADFVCLKDVDDETIQLTLVHCKGAHDARISKDIRNFYVVCGQAQKSIVARHSGIGSLYHDLKRRHDIWAKEGVSRFLKGDMKLLSYFKEKARRSKLQFEVILIQPGGSVATLTDDILRLLATTELYLVKTTQAKFRVVTSS